MLHKLHKQMYFVNNHPPPSLATGITQKIFMFKMDVIDLCTKNWYKLGTYIYFSSVNSTWLPSFWECFYLKSEQSFGTLWRFNQYYNVLSAVYRWARSAFIISFVHRLWTVHFVRFFSFNRSKNNWICLFSKL